MQEKTKNIWQSKTVWSSLVVVVISVLTTFGIIKPGEVDAEQATVNVFAIVQGLAGLLAIYGRITAKSKVKAPGVSSILIFFFLMLLIGGCQDLQKIKEHPRAEVKLAQKTLEELVLYSVELKNNGILKGEDLEQVRAVANSANSLIVEWTRYVQENEKRPDTADAALALIEQLKEILKNKERK